MSVPIASVHARTGKSTPKAADKLLIIGIIVVANGILSTKALAIALLIVIGALYSLCRIIFGSLKLFAGLPVIKFVDEVLGLIAGAAKAFMLLYVVDYIVKIWLNL